MELGEGGWKAACSKTFSSDNHSFSSEYGFRYTVSPITLISVRTQASEISAHENISDIVIKKPSN